MSRHFFLLNGLRASCCKAAFICGLVVTLFAPATHADTALSTPISSRIFQQALATNDHVSLYNHRGQGGFSITSAYFADTTAPNIAAFDSTQRLYALLIDGRYDFNYETPALTSPLRPYVMGGMGVATTGHAATSDSLSSMNMAMAPLFRLGGGVTYRLDPQWNLSLDYKAGIATPTANAQTFTVRGQQQPVDLQSLNLGMQFTF